MNPHRRNFLLLGTLILTASGCASSPSISSSDDTAPIWITKPETNFPADRYLVAVGTGSNRDRAIEDAKKSMAESFVVRVQSFTEAKSNSTLKSDTDGNRSGEASDDVQKNVSLHTDTYLRGTQVKEVYTQGSQTQALLVLDKLTARAGLMMESNRIKGELTNALDSLEEKFTQEKFALAKTKFAEMQTLYGEASALGMSALVETAPLETRFHKIESALRSKNSKLSFIVNTVKGETYFERDIEACINDRGGVLLDEKQSTVAKTSDKANRVQITVVERPQHLPIEGWVRIRFDLTAAIVQANGNKFRIQTTETETARSRDAVMETVSDRMAANLCDRLFSRISEMN